MSMSVSLATQLIAISVISLQRQVRHNEVLREPPPGPTYDFVVVGAGAAGSAVAYRLAEQKYSVVLLEAGGPQNLATDMPALAYTIKYTDVVWPYQTQRGNMGLGWANSTVPAPKGKLLLTTSTNYIFIFKIRQTDWRHL